MRKNQGKSASRQQGGSDQLETSSEAESDATETTFAQREGWDSAETSGETENKDQPITDSLFGNEIRPIKAADSRQDLLGKMENSLEDIWVSLMLNEETRPKTIMICGAAKDEGASFLSFYLSLFMALQRERRVLYIDADMAGGQNEFFASSESEGLLGFFDKGADLSSLVHGTQFTDFYVLPRGVRQDRAGIMNFAWHKERMSEVIEFCRTHFDITVFDSQPVLSNPAMIEYAKAVDQVLLVCRYGRSRREVSRVAIEKLTAGGANVVGAILNAREYPVPSNFYKRLG